MPKPNLSEDRNANLFQKLIDGIRLIEYYGDTLIENVSPGGGVLAGAQRSTTELESDANGTVVLLGAGPVARTVVVKITVTEAFADGSGGQPDLLFGVTGDTDALAAATLLADAQVGQVFTLAGTLDADDQLLATATAATGNGTGAVRVEVAAVPSEV